MNLRIARITTPLLLATALAFGTVWGDEADASKGTAATPAQDERAVPKHERPPRKPMSDEDRAAMRERYESMSEEEKQAMRDKRAERRAKWQAMSEEERQAAREKFRQNRADRPRPERQELPEGAADGT
jgi:hypothetical protein